MVSDAPLQKMYDAALELAQYASYAEIVGAVGHNRKQIREWCDKVFALHHEIEAGSLEAALSSAQAPEPVAWRYRKPCSDGGWTVWLLSYDDPRWTDPDIEIEPLFAAPQPLAAQAPEGWQLVPTKHDGLAGMTHEMADALWRTFTDAHQHHGFYESMNAGYNAMLKASPQPPAAQAPEWQPIETAPKDGTVIRIKGDRGPYGVAAWEGHASWGTPVNWHRDSSTWLAPSDRPELKGAVLHLAGYVPTHWQPALPAAPQPPAGEQ